MERPKLYDLLKRESKTLSVSEREPQWISGPNLCLNIFEVIAEDQDAVWIIRELKIYLMFAWSTERIKFTYWDKVT